MPGPSVPILQKPHGRGGDKEGMMDRRSWLARAAGVLFAATPSVSSPFAQAAPPGAGVSLLGGKWIYRSFHNRSGSLVYQWPIGVDQVPRSLAP